MSGENTRKIVGDFLHGERIGVLTTVSPTDLQPHAAVVAVTETESLEIVFGTSNTTGKYRDLQANPKVSFVIGVDFDRKISVQYVGSARELSGQELSQYQDLHIAKHPNSRKFLNLPDERLFVVSPVWVRYSDYESSPPVKFELSDF